MNSDNISTEHAHKKEIKGLVLIPYVCQNTKVIPAKKLGATPTIQLEANVVSLIRDRKGEVEKSQIIKNDITHFK
jgi:hypothetical protein